MADTDSSAVLGPPRVGSVATAGILSLRVTGVTFLDLGIGIGIPAGPSLGHTESGFGTEASKLAYDWNRVPRLEAERGGR